MTGHAGPSVARVSGFDLDEVNVCRTLHAEGVAVPSAGMVRIGVSGSGIYAWVKNLSGKFFKTVDEPFAGRVTGVAKTECRVIPQTVVDLTDLFDKVSAQQPEPPIVQLICVEDTADGIGTDCNDF